MNTSLGLLFVGEKWPEAPLLAGALVLGCVSYGVSVVLDAYALRLIGAAREAAYFATAPFVGALVSVMFLGDEMGGYDLLAMVAMGMGAMLLLRERHAHVHEHEPLEHEHLHEHDEHHRHEHGTGDPPGVPHSHWHRHEPLVHDHPHTPDVHHRHAH
jgi:hypothetical protein